MAGYALAPAVASGRLVYLPLRLSAVPRLLMDTMTPDIAVITGVRRGGELAFGSSVGWAPVAAMVAGAVVVEIDEDGPDLGGPLIPGRIVATVARPTSEGPLPVPRVPDAIDLQVGRNVASVVPEGATLQFGREGSRTAFWPRWTSPSKYGPVWSATQLPISTNGAFFGAPQRLAMRGAVTRCGASRPPANSACFPSKKPTISRSCRISSASSAATRPCRSASTVP